MTIDVERLLVRKVRMESDSWYGKMRMENDSWCGKCEWKLALGMESVCMVNQLLLLWKECMVNQLLLPWKICMGS